MSALDARVRAFADSLTKLSTEQRIALAAELVPAGDLALAAVLLRAALDEITYLRLCGPEPERFDLRIQQVLAHFNVRPSRSVVDTVQILKRVSTYRLSSSTETVLHDQLARVFDDLLPGEDIRHEFSCAGISRLDFYLPRLSLGIEVKIAGSADDVARQLERYAGHTAAIRALVLITGHLRHVSQLLQTGRVRRAASDSPCDFAIGETPLAIIPLGGQLL